MLLLSACTGGGNTAAAYSGSVSQESVSDNTSVSEDEPLAAPTVTPSPTDIPTPTVSEDMTVSEDEAVSDNTVSENEITPTQLPTPDPAKITPMDTVTMYVISQVNVRKGPSADYEKVGLLNPGDTVTVTGTYSGKWMRAEYKGETVYVFGDCLSKEPPATPTPVPEVPQQENPAPTPTPTPVPVAPPVQVSAPAGVLMIGDSRCVQMRDVTGGGGASWICENSKGYEWFVSTALGQADAVIGRGTKVVICLGVNDTDNGYSYSSLINQKAAEWAARGAKTYFVSVNPVGDNPYTDNDNVSAFNSIMVNNLSGVKYIDTWSYLVTHGYNMVDGMHFDGPTNATVFSLIISNL